MRINHNLIRSVFTIGAVVGVAATAYFAAKNGEQICEETRDIVEKVKAEDSKSAKIKAAVKNIPSFAKVAWKPLVAGGFTYGCMFASRRVTAKQIAALTATCAYVTRNRNFLEGKLKEYVGEEELAKIKKEFVTKEVVREKIVWGGPTIEISSHCTDDNPGVLCLEGCFGRWFRCPREDVELAQQLLKKMFDEDIYCCMNDYYGLLGITMTQAGNEWGWVNNDDYYDDIRFVNTELSPEEWRDAGPDGGEINETIYILEMDNYSFPMQSWQEI